MAFRNPTDNNTKMMVYNFEIKLYGQCQIAVRKTTGDYPEAKALPVSKDVTFTMGLKKLEQNFVIEYKFKNSDERLKKILNCHIKLYGGIKSKNPLIMEDFVQGFSIGPNETANKYSPEFDLNYFLIANPQHTTEEMHLWFIEPEESEQSNSLIQSMLNLFHDDTDKDIKFVVQDESFAAHSLIVKCRSKVMRAMLENDTKEKEEKVIEIKDTNAEAFKSFLKYIYTNEIDNIEELAEDLIILAEKYDLQCLKNNCEQYLLTKVDKTNIIRYLVIAHLYNCKIFKQELLDKMRFYIKDIVNNEEFDELENFSCLYKDIIKSIVGFIGTGGTKP